MSLVELIEKWEDCLACAEDRTERTLAEEIVKDLKRLQRLG
jgi:hypothetical protein